MELIEQIRAGSVTAFEQLFRAQFAPLSAYAYRFLRSNELAEDVAQTVLADIWTRRELLPDPQNVTAFLRARVRQRAIDVLRHELRSENVESEDVLASNIDNPGKQIENTELREAVDAAFATLPRRARLIAIMRWEDGLSQSEIAAELGLSVRTVNAQLVKAARPIRELLRRFKP